MSFAPTPHPPLPSQVPTPLSGWPVLRLGFRPFYLLTAAFACLAVPVWVAAFLGYLPWNRPLSALLWHGHEMLFGFAAGVVIGFLLTAVRAWTGAMTARGPLLGALALLWLAARVAALWAPYVVFAVLDLLLLPVVALLLLRVLVQAGNRRNMPLVGLLLLMAIANLLFHLGVLQLLAVDPMQMLHAQLALILLVVTVITGRVVPMFTKNVTPGLVIQSSGRFEWSLLAITAVALILWAGAAPAAVVALASAAAALMHALRLYRWSPWVTLKRPILWVLHLSYAWLPLGLAMLALSQWGWVGESLAIHALAVGVVGGLIIGMVTRTARGHTGRALVASAPEVGAYVLVLSAAVLRAVVPAVQPEWYVRMLEISATLWALAFVLYLVVYTPWLLRTRLDGKDG